MTDIPLPATGSNNWTGWAAEQENLSDQIRNLGMVNVKDYGAVGDGTTNDTAAIQAAVDALDDTNGGVVLFPPGRYNFTALNITTKRVTLDGPGVLLNGTVNVGVQTGGFAAVSLYTGIRVGFDRTTKSSTVNAISIANAHDVEIAVPFAYRYRALVHFPAMSLGGAFTQHAARIRVSGCYTPSWPDGVTSDALDYLVYVNPNTTGGLFSVGDLTVTNNPSVMCRIAHIYGSGIDGLVCTGNTFFFPGYAEANATKTNNIHLLGNSGFITIADNKLFEAGYEGILIEGDPREGLAITGNEIAWSGQRDLRDGINVTLGSTVNLRGIIAGNNINRYTKAAVAVYGTGDVSGLAIGPNSTFTENPNPSYYGTTTLPTTFSRYTSAAGLLFQPRIKDIAGAYYDQVPIDTIGAVSAESSQRLGYASNLGSRRIYNKSVTAANTVLGQFSGAGGSATIFGGLVIVNAEDLAPNHSATYLLNVASTNGGKSLSQVSVQGEFGGLFAQSPAFTFTINSSGQLLASPIGSTTGAFTFGITTLGNLTFT